METAEIRELISAFVPEEILRDFELREVEKEVVRCGYMNPCEIRTFPTAFPCISTGVYRFPESGSSSNRVTLHFRIYSG
ncbi:hypothetical protein HMPREF2890_03455 [Porphyromonas sp. HMSC065F10]|nr:hypothetical protein HMPREF2890_03455 [Porphyromonas sp. HMSC065F10]